MRWKIRRGWGPWFAWRPVVADNEVAWLETVERRWVWTDGYGGAGGYWEYRLPPAPPEGGHPA